MLLNEVVTTSGLVAATPSRSAKVAAIAGLLRRLDDEEIGPATAFVAGEPRQGRSGVGWATVGSVQVAPASAPSLTVGDLDAVLDQLSRLTGNGSGAARQLLLLGLLGRATVEEGAYIRRLILGELRQGALDGVVTEAVARAAGVGADAVRRALMLRGDLPGVARLALTEGAAGLAGVTLEVLRPVQPMLASTAADVTAAVAGLGLCSVEWKLDGARMQAHRSGPEVRLFTRNLNEVTSRFPGVVAALRDFPAERFVLDGEVLGVADDERPDAFQHTMSRFGRHDGTGRDLTAWWFDCLHLDGEDLIDRPLTQRAGALASLVGRSRVPAVMTADPREAAAFLAGALAAGHEGVVVKSASSPYEAGRRGRAWRKVKPVLTLDLVVLAAEWGHGRRKGWLSNLHLGARHPDGGWVMVGKTFKGLTDRMLAWQTDALLEREVARRGIVVEVRPELVVEIALDGVQTSSRYPGGVALRFARVRRYRPDKSPEQADGIDSVRALPGGPPAGGDRGPSAGGDSGRAGRG